MPSDDPRFQHIREMRLNVFELDLRSSIALSDRWFAEALLPLRIAGVSWSDGHERVYGPGDVEASIRHRLYDDRKTRLDLRAGVSLPFGESGPLFEGPDRRERYLFGTGTFDPIIAAQGSAQLSRDRLIYYGWVRLPFMENIFDVRAGLRATLGVGYAVARPSWSLIFSAGYYHQSAAKTPDLVHSLSAAHDDLFLSAAVELWKTVELGLVLPLTLRVGSAAAYHSPWMFSLTTRFGVD